MLVLPQPEHLAQMVVVQALVALEEDLKTSAGVFADDKGAQMQSKQVVGV